MLLLQPLNCEYLICLQVLRDGHSAESAGANDLVLLEIVDAHDVLIFYEVYFR